MLFEHSILLLSISFQLTLLLAAPEREAADWVLVPDPENPEEKIPTLKDAPTTKGRGLIISEDKFTCFLVRRDLSEEAIDLENLDPATTKVDKTADWYFGLHGWTSNHRETPLTPNLIREIFGSGSANVILVDWSGAASPLYPSAAKSAKLTGMRLANTINSLVWKGLAGKEKINLYGFSLGGQAVGFVGKTLFAKYGWRPNKITGVDAAGPLFEGQPPDERINFSDGEYVELIHTSGDKLGLWKPVGHVDIYVNKGKTMQPGCNLFNDLSGACSHIYGKTVYGNLTHFNLKAYKCNSFAEFEQGGCADDKNFPCPIHFKSDCPSGVYHLNSAPFS